MKTPLLSLLVCCIIHSCIAAQTLRRPLSAPYASFGAYSTNHADVFSFSGNQASLAALKKLTAGVYAERRFMLAALNNYYAAVAVPAASGNFGLKTNYTGFSDYNETAIGIAYARSLGTKAGLGVQFNYHTIQIAGYGSSGAIGVEAGVILHLTEKLHAGLQVSNPVGGKFGNGKQEKLPAVYTTGFGYEASEKCLVSIEIQKEEDRPVTVNAGLQYKPVQQLLVRAGIASATSSVWGGAGILFNNCRVDVTASFHPQLGVSPGLMLMFTGKNKK